MTGTEMVMPFCQDDEGRESENIKTEENFK